MAHISLANTDKGEMAAYINKFQAYIAEIEIIDCQDYSDFKMNRMPLSNIKNTSHPEVQK